MHILHQKATSKTVFFLINTDMLISQEYMTTETLISFKEDRKMLAHESSEMLTSLKKKNHIHAKTSEKVHVSF